jgi:hypothetical protein
MLKPANPKHSENDRSGNQTTMSNPRFTALIPTRNRSETLASTIATCLAQNYDNFRMIVSDNVSEDATADLLSSIDDPRLIVVRPDQRLSMTGNFEFAMRHADQGYVMHLGDDDGLLPGGVAAAAAIVGETGCDAVTSNHAVYHWPNSLFEGHRNMLTMQLASGFEVRDAREHAQKAARYECAYSALPGTYISFVSTALIERAKRDGRYFRSITPDCYSAFLNIAYLDRYAFSKRAFALSGISGRSNGASQIVATDPKEAASYQAENDIPFHPRLVYCPRSVEIVVAEAFLQAREHAGDLLDVDFDLSHACYVALRDSSPQNYPFVAAAVREISNINGLGLSVPDHKSRLLMMKGLAKKTARRAGQLWAGTRRFDCTPLGARTIDDACRIAAVRLDAV